MHSTNLFCIQIDTHALHANQKHKQEHKRCPCMGFPYEVTSGEPSDEFFATAVETERRNEKLQPATKKIKMSAKKGTNVILMLIVLQVTCLLQVACIISHFLLRHRLQ